MFLLLLVLVLFFVYKKNLDTTARFVHLREIEKTQDYDSLSSRVTEIAKGKGAEYAFGLLKEANMPENVDLHLLAHVVGDVLYKEKGKDGLSICTDDFRNACAHSIVIGMFIENGVEALEEIESVCKKSPGGKGAYMMCFHGLGHGVLAYTGYDLEAAVGLCKRTGTVKNSFREVSECISGSIMEMVSGVHDVKTWESQKGNYFKDGDPLYPCTAEYIPNEAKYMCLQYLTPRIMEAAKIDLGNPDPSLYSKAFGFCEREDLDGSLKDACNGGFGKEFVAIASARKIESLDSLSLDALQNVIDWCEMSRTKEGFRACYRDAINSLYWGGENGYQSSIKMCSLMTDGEKTECFSYLLGVVKYYSPNSKYVEKFCKEVGAYYPACS